MQKSFQERVAEARVAVPSVTPEEANALRLSNSQILFIDPRDSESIRSTTGRIPGALSLPLDELAELPSKELPEALVEHTRPIITACQGGPLGAIAAHVLQRRGFSNVAFIEGGTQGWLDAGYTTVQ